MRRYVRNVKRHDDIVGTWTLVGAAARSKDQTYDSPFGMSPRGLLIYTSSGEMTAIISYGGRAPLSGDRVSAPEAERAEAFATFFAYAGRYSVSDRQLVHHVELASVENWVGTDLVRAMELDGDRLTLRTPPLSVGGDARVTDLTWQRISAH